MTAMATAAEMRRCLALVAVAAMLLVVGENVSIRGSSCHGMVNLSKWSIVPFLQDENHSID
jgi:hypothetical protein